VRRIGVLTPIARRTRWKPFHEPCAGSVTLRGANIAFEWRSSAGEPSASHLAAELVHLKVDVIVASENQLLPQHNRQRRDSVVMSSLWILSRADSLRARRGRVATLPD